MQVTRTAKVLGSTILIVVIAAALYLRFLSPDLLRVATNYSAKIVCSSVFISGRDADDVLKIDVQAPGHPILRYVTVDVDQEENTVSAQMFGFAAPAVAQHRTGLGCTNRHHVALSDATVPAMQSSGSGIWPEGQEVVPRQNPEIESVLSDEDLLGQGYRAVVIVQNGRIIGETYADGFSAQTPLLGWSMTKTVTAALIGTLIQSGELSLDDDLTEVFNNWQEDNRAEITVSDMLAMTSGLTWNEGYGSVSDVTRMLYLTDDMAEFAATNPTEAAPNSFFNYSSGTSTMLSRVWQDKLGEAALLYPQTILFAPLGMTSATLETDASDTFVGSSYMYATARDWARFGLFLLQDGVWDGQRILPEGYVDWMFEPVETSEGLYARGHLWREASGDRPPFEDAVWLRGHDGQSMAIFPSRDLVIVRLGLTPSRVGYSSLPLAKAVISALGDT
ncbi:serine hydrolase domain-containing protein [Yoonia litorea]|uniref:CubicO group peptidase, beta-lactamase class C family n=1 Tax=Yoonia litorea TaxID=1123755 RepID=A0A1I6MWU9_9RHOB|nr:serine hydrolase [Yoonia litorea]SFS20193.1 CubicO group peptidase, beta-lactamase class C family [Yoonia litorea]